MNSVCGEFFDWLINEREPYPITLSKELCLTAETGRVCPVNRGPVLSLPKDMKREECITDGKKDE